MISSNPLIPVGDFFKLPAAAASGCDGFAMDHPSVYLIKKQQLARILHYIYYIYSNGLILAIATFLYSIKIPPMNNNIFPISQP
jgi:hypothetical protein